MQKINIYDHFENVIDRLSRQIEAKYKVGFKYFTSEQWRELDVSKNIPVASALEAIHVSVIVSDSDTYLPVVIRGELACTIKLTNTNHLTGPELTEISDTVDLVIGGSMDLLQKAESLENDLCFKEKHLREDVLDTEPPSNVVMMEKFSYLRKDNHVIIDEAPTAGEETDDKDGIMTDIPIFIHAKTSDQVAKIAHEIYTYSKKIACISINDIRKQNEDFTLEFLKSLGEICLVIPEVASLSQESTDIVTEFLLARKRGENNDLLMIFGSSKSASELISSKSISLNFYKLISSARLNHLEETLTQDHLSTHIQSLLLSQKDLYVLTLLSQMGLSAFNVDDLV